MATNKSYKMNKESKQIGVNDLIFQMSEGKIYSGGFTINTRLLKGGIAPMSYFNNNSSDSEEPVGVFGGSGGYIVPPFFFIPPTETQHGGKPKNTYNYEEDHESEIISDDLHDKLLQLAEAKMNRKKGTARLQRKSSKRQTKKQLKNI
jgi:hypothetical protein